MNMRAVFFGPGADSNPNEPVCSYCNHTEDRHEPADHPFDAVGGSLSAIDLRCGPPPIGVLAPVDIREWVAKGLFIAALALIAWGGFVVAGLAALHAIQHHLHT